MANFLLSTQVVLIVCFVIFYIRLIKREKRVIEELEAQVINMSEAHSEVERLNSQFERILDLHGRLWAFMMPRLDFPDVHEWYCEYVPDVDEMRRRGKTDPAEDIVGEYAGEYFEWERMRMN